MGATAGQTRWVLMPQDYSNIESIKSFSLTSVEKELDGLLLTLWDDDSPHFELYKRGIYAFAEYTWGGNTLFKSTTNPELCVSIFPINRRISGAVHGFLQQAHQILPRLFFLLGELDEDLLCSLSIEEGPPHVQEAELEAPSPP